MDAFPVYQYKRTILNVGCGEGRLDRYLVIAGYHVYATDIKKPEGWDNLPNLQFHVADILDLSSFPISSASIVICSQVLEHIKDYKTALSNLIKLMGVRLIITVPFGKSFNSPGHVNYWVDGSSERFKDINEFIELCKPYSTSISKIITKPQDLLRNHRNYLIIIDKRQKTEA